MKVIVEFLPRRRGLTPRAAPLRSRTRGGLQFSHLLASAGCATGWSERPAEKRPASDNPDKNNKDGGMHPPVLIDAKLKQLCIKNRGSSFVCIDKVERDS